MSTKLESPWKEFLEELDSLLKEPVTLHCIGGFAVVAAFGLRRATNDLDYFTLEPKDCGAEIERLAGQRSALARRYKVHVQRAAVATVPEGYEDRLIELFPGHFKNMRLLVLEVYDLLLSKLSRNIDRDREDVKYLAQTFSLDPNALRRRYHDEMRALVIGDVKQRDDALDFWIEAYFSMPK
jgi:Nucleotidyltransferase of unknown function (DUF6036)